MKKILYSLLFILVLPASSKAQLSMDDIFLGGNVGATFGTVTLVNISPMIGYKFTDRTIAGISLTYQYYKDARYTPTLKSNIYGTGVCVRSHQCR